MKIGIYTYNIKAGRSGGVQQYSTWLIQALLEYTDHEIFVFTNLGLAKTDYYSFGRFTNYREIILPSKIRFYRALINNRLFLKFSLGNFINTLCNHKPLALLFAFLGDVRPMIYKFKLDVLHFPTQVMPHFAWSLPTLISLHDLQHIHLPEFFSKKRIEEREFFYRLSASACSQIMVTFDHVKKDLVRHFNISSEKLSVTSIGYEIPEELIEQADSYILDKLKIPPRFVLYPARTWKHKNHLFLLDALALYIDKYDKEVFLVCAGGKNEYYKVIEEKVFEKGLEKNVIFPGYLSEKDLIFLFKKTALVVVPTLYEAGSGPLLQAIFLSTPVICSNVTSLPDVTGDNRFVFDPTDKEELCELMHKMLTDENFRKENIKNSHKQAERFNWADVIKNFLAAYDKAIENYNQVK